MVNKLQTAVALSVFAIVWGALSLIVYCGGEAIKAMAADPPPRGLSTVAEVVDCYDGDTITANLSIKVRVRILDCWAPEVRGIQKPQGLKSKEKMLELCPVGSKVRLFIPATGRLQDSLTFGRVLGKIWVPGENGKWIDVAEEMVKSGHATKEKVR